jgi:hypothetical protein
MKLRAGFLCVLFLAAACQQLSTGPEPSAVSVRTEASTFVRDAAFGSAMVPFAVENRGRSTLYLARCGERLLAALDRLESGQWVQHSGDACQTVYAMDPRHLAPGATITSVHRVNEPGRYRLRPGVLATAGGPRSWTAAVSNEFTVE